MRAGCCDRQRPKYGYVLNRPSVLSYSGGDNDQFFELDVGNTTGEMKSRNPSSFSSTTDILLTRRSVWAFDITMSSWFCEIHLCIGVQGTCKYGTRVDYIMASPDSPFRFVPGSYSVYSSKGTSDHHIVKVDLVRSAIAHYNQGHNKNMDSTASKKRRQGRHSKQQKRVVKITNPSLHQSNGVWKNAVIQNYTQTGKLMDWYFIFMPPPVCLLLVC